MLRNLLHLKLRQGVLPIGILLATTGCANYLSIGTSGTRFREENAPFAGNGLVGYAQGDASHHRFVRQSKQPIYDGLAVRPVTVQHDAVTEKAAVKARLDAWKVASGNTEATAEKKVKGRYDIIEVTDDLPSKLNARRNARVLQDLANWGKAARIVTAVAIAYGYQSTTDHTFSGDATAKYDLYSGTLETGGSRRRTIRLSNGTVFAYRMSRICWKRDDKGRLMVAEIVPDDPGHEMHCPSGSSDDPSQLVNP